MGGPSIGSNAQNTSCSWHEHPAKGATNYTMTQLDKTTCIIYIILADAMAIIQLDALIATSSVHLFNMLEPLTAEKLFAPNALVMTAGHRKKSRPPAG